jgi:hypothetical protein
MYVWMRVWKPNFLPFKVYAWLLVGMPVLMLSCLNVFLYWYLPCLNTCLPTCLQPVWIPAWILYLNGRLPTNMTDTLCKSSSLLVICLSGKLLSWMAASMSVWITTASTPPSFRMAGYLDTYLPTFLDSVGLNIFYLLPECQAIFSYLPTCKYSKFWRLYRVLLIELLTLRPGLWVLSYPGVILSPG